MTTKAMQFDGTMGSAKAIAAWVNDPTKLIAGPSYFIEQGVPDTAPGGVDLIGEKGGAPFYTTAYAGDYVVKAGGNVAVFTAEQYAVAFPG